MSRQVLDMTHMVRETLSPPPDGFTTVFQTSRPYTPGTVSLFVNGLLYAAAADPWRYTEGGGTALVLAQAPRAGDTLQAQYEAR